MARDTKRLISPYDMTHQRVAAAAVTAGEAVCIDATNTIVPAGTAGSLSGGRACNDAAIGEVVNFESGIFKWTNDGTNPVGVANVMDLCYWENATTVSTLATGNEVAGIVYDIDADGGIWVLTMWRQQGA